MTEAQHALLSPSSAARWSRCTAAPHEEAKYPDTPSAASELGTYAHEAYEMWSKGEDPMNHPYCDDEMFNNLALVVQYVRNRCNEAHMKMTGIESKVDVGIALGFLPGIIWGTLDTSLGNDERIEIIDLKYGTWPVDPVKNEQLVLYLGGVLGDQIHFLPDEFPVRLTIAQPRAREGGAIRFWDTNLGVIKGHLQRLSAAANEAYQNPTFTPGEKQCQWCAHRNNCEARRAENTSIVETHFQRFADQAAQGDKPSAEWLSEIMARIPQVENWISDIRKEAYARAQAGQLPGWKLIQGRKARKWTDPEASLSKIQRWRIDGKALGLDVTRPRGELSVTQAEKIPGLSDKQKKMLAEMQTVSYGKPVLVPEADPRPAVTIDVESHFAALEDAAES